MKRFDEFISSRMDDDDEEEKKRKILRIELFFTLFK